MKSGRENVLVTTVLSLVFGALLASAGRAAPDAVHADPAHPDVLVVICDQWSPRYVSWDNPQVRTPNLDRIAGEGMIFDSCYVTAPICMPSRVSLVTGLYPHDHGHAIWANANGYYLPPQFAPMFRDIKEAGYSTAQIGKLHWYTGANWKNEFKTIDDYNRAMGLDTVASITGPPDSEADKDPYCQHLKSLNLLNTVTRDIRQRLLKSEYEARASVVGPENYHDTFVAGLAVDYIRRQPKDKPLFLTASFHSPHPPLDAPGEYATIFDPAKIVLPDNVPDQYDYDRHKIDKAQLRGMVANYLGKMALADHCIGELVEAMKARGTWDNTLFIFTSDHGEMMGAHGYMSKGRLWDESARVPLVMRWPGQIKVGRTPALAQMFDVYPTVVEAIGGKQSPGNFARSLLPVATGKKKSVRDLVISEIGNSAPLSMMARDTRYKWWVDTTGDHLFDMQSDHLEQHDLAGVADQRDLLNQMREKALTFLRFTEVNFAQGSKSKVSRTREKEAAREQ